MFKKSSFILILVLAAMLLLVSCERAASQPSATSLGTPTGTGSVAVEPAGMGNVEQIGTTQMIQTLTAFYAQTQTTSTPVGTASTPNTFTLVPPTGFATTPPAATTPAPGITPVIIVATATPGRPANYTLMPGEFPYCIARRFNVNPDDLLALNGLTSGQILQPGMVLRIPQTGSFPGNRALHSHPGTYTVSSVDDSIYKVACYYGNIDPTQIIAANGLVSPYTLHVNQTLNIP